jgi:hypothetical protein
MKFWIWLKRPRGKEGMVEKTKRKGRLNGALNATFLSLIPKSNKP